MVSNIHQRESDEVDDEDCSDGELDEHLQAVNKSGVPNDNKAEMSARQSSE